MPLPVSLIEMMNTVKTNILLLSYISSKYVLEILASMIIILSYISMFISYGLMNISNKLHVFINITYNDFDDYELNKFLDKSIKNFYTKFPSMKKYFVEQTIKQESSPTFSSKNEIVDLTEDSDSENLEEEEENEINEPSADEEEEENEPSADEEEEENEPSADEENKINESSR